jgi:predicted DNA-binding transcriptional regulator AlpA
VQPLAVTTYSLPSVIVVTVIDGYVPTERAAEILGIKRESVWDYVKRLPGFPQPVKIGRTLLFKETALREWRGQHPARKAVT